MFFSNRPEDVLQADFLEEYKATCNVIQNSFERLHINRFALEKIRLHPVPRILDEFPVALSMFFFNGIETCILLCTKLASDQGDGNITLNNFKNRILKNLLSEELRLQFNNALKKTKVGPRRLILEKLKLIRDLSIAHLDHKVASVDFKHDQFLWKDLDDVISYIKKYSDVLAFYQSVLYRDTLAYHPETGTSDSTISDFESVLQALEDNSRLIKNIGEYQLDRDFWSEELDIEAKNHINSILARTGQAVRI